MSDARPTPDPGDEVAWVGEHLGGLWSGPLAASPRFRGGASRADAALDAYDVTGYARTRSEVWPEARRGASALSPYIRHGLLTLPRVWSAVAGPANDVRKFHDELLWQEYARHLYARLGAALARPLRAERDVHSGGGDPWPTTMACMALTVGELEGDGWLVNQTRMWLASQWAVRSGADWREGENRFFTHLLDGSRAANRLGWQWAAGSATGKPYGFSRWQVETRAPGVCATCELRRACPIEGWPDAEDPTRRTPDPRLRTDPDPGATAGPAETERGGDGGDPEVVWITAESLGDDDPALAANPGLPAVFTFDAPLLRRLALSAKRLVFLTECLADLATRRELEIHVGDPVESLAGRAVATTFTPVPGWRRRSRDVDLATTHPWAWLHRPTGGSVASFSAWSEAIGLPRWPKGGGRRPARQGRRDTPGAGTHDPRHDGGGRRARH